MWPGVSADAGAGLVSCDTPRMPAWITLRRLGTATTLYAVFLAGWWLFDSRGGQTAVTLLGEA